MKILKFIFLDGESEGCGTDALHTRREAFRSIREEEMKFVKKNIEKDIDIVYVKKLRHIFSREEILSGNVVNDGTQ